MLVHKKYDKVKIYKDQLKLKTYKKQILKDACEFEKLMRLFLKKVRKNG